MNTTKSLPKAWEAIDTKLNKGSYNGSASDLKTLIDGKEPTINKKSGFNLDKSDAINSANSNTLATSTAVKTAYDKGLEGVNVANTKLTRGNLPAGLTDSKSLYDLLENNGGLNMDPNLLYLNDAGEKIKGKVYFDKNKKGLFECIETTSSTTNSTTYFVDISNKASSDRLNNLDKIETSEFYHLKNYGQSVITVHKIGNEYWLEVFLYKDYKITPKDIIIKAGTILCTIKTKIFKGMTVFLSYQGSTNSVNYPYTYLYLDYNTGNIMLCKDFELRGYAATAFFRIK